MNSLRRDYDIPKLEVYSRNNFPSSSGLASSASGFAALIAAINGVCELELSDAGLCEWARRGSASAARSIHGGFVAMSVTQSEVTVWQVLDEEAWPLEVVVAIASHKPKHASSTEGMKRSKATSPFYTTWVKQSEENFKLALHAIQRRDFEKLAQVAETSCRQMHALMLTSEPTLRYWNQATLGCIQAVETMQEEGLSVFYTIDAGAQVKVVCLPDDCEHVATKLVDVPDVVQVMLSGIGGPVTVC